MSLLVKKGGWTPTGDDGTKVAIADIANVIEAAVVGVDDYSGDLSPKANVLFPWTVPAKLANPAELPAGNGRGCAWSPNGEFLSVAHTANPYIVTYQRNGTTFTKLANPAALPAGAVYSCAWSPNGEFLSVGHAAYPFLTIYQRSGTTFTKLANRSE